MKKLLLLSGAFVALSGSLMAQRQMEQLDRGLVAIKTNQGVYTSWRIPGDEYYGVTYNLYRDGSLIASGLEVSNYQDAAGTAGSTYQVTPVVNGVEGSKCDAVSVWADQYLEFPLKPVINPKTGRDVTRVMQITDSSVADLDGDGVYEFIIERQNTDVTVANDSAYTRFEAYEMDGTKLWEVNLGPNMRDGNGSENACFAFDFDQDGKAEVIFRGGDGTILPDGTILGNPNVNYRTDYSSTQTFMEQGDEFIVMLDGATGATLDYQIFDREDGGYNTTSNNKPCPSGVYEPGTSAPGNNLARRSVSFWMEGSTKSDGGHRATKFYFGAPYLDGVHPFVYIGRGCYTNFHAATWRVVNKKLQLYWACACDDWNSPFYGQGYHNFSVVDVDGDGRDELCQGNMVVDEYGKFHSSTGLGHGDAQHYGDLDPFRDGIEGFRCLEDNPGAVYVDANTSEVLFRWKRGNDCGRCMAGNFTDKYPGAQLWTVDNNLWSATTTRDPNDRVATSAPGVTMNARIYWDGDILEESMDYVSCTNYQGYDMSVRKFDKGQIFATSGCLTINSTKGNPCVQADIFGDWREEFMLPTADNRSVRIYTTTDVTAFRNYTLMHDPQYRQAVYWQCSGYNQPPHVSYFLGNLEGILLPPPPQCTNGKVQIGTTLDNSTNGQFALACNTSNTSVTASGSVSPSWLQVNSPANYTISGGSFTGSTSLLKQGQGSLTLEGGTYNHTGNTEVWYGSLVLKGNYTTSPIVMKRFSKLISGMSVGDVSMEYGAVLQPAGEDQIGSLTAKNLNMQGGAILELDMKNDGTAFDQLSVENFVIGEANCIGATPVLRIRREAQTSVAAGEYVILSASNQITGDVGSITIEGMEGLSCSLQKRDNQIVLVVNAMRAPSDIIYSGTGDWDLNNSESFLIGDQPVSFVSGDHVTIDATEKSVIINVAEDVAPGSITVIGSKNVVIKGNGKIGGNGTLTKKGAGTLSIQNVNDFTGVVSIEEGSISISSFADAQNIGALGAYCDGQKQIHIASGAQLTTTAAGILDAAITVGDSAFIVNSAALTIQGSLSGERLIKAGNGTLSWTCDPDLRRADLKSGVWNIGYCSGKTNMADTMYLYNGTTLAFTSGSLYQYCNNAWVVMDGATVTISPSNCVQYRNRLLGSGTVKWTWHNSSTPREYLEGDWSEFTGTVQFTGQSVDHPVRLCNTKGMPNGTIQLMNANTVLTIGGDPDSKKEHGATVGDYHIGNLIAAKGSCLGVGYDASNTFYVGSKNLDFTYAGNNNAPLVKEGTGLMTMTSNTGTGNVTIAEGNLRINGGTYTDRSNYTSGSGKGALIMKSGTQLMATGCIGNSSFVIESGAVFQPGYYYTGTLGIACLIDVKEGGKVQFRLSKNNTCNGYTGGSNSALKGTVEIIANTNYTPAAGDEFHLWTTRAFSATQNTPTIDLSSITLPDSLMWDTSELLTKNGILRVVANPDYVDALEEISVVENADVYFNLAGQKVNTLEPGQIYIHRGKKVMIR